MKRAQVLASLRVAGAENDSREFVRLYTENKVAYKVAIEQFRKGAAMGAAGMRVRA